MSRSTLSKIIITAALMPVFAVSASAQLLGGGSATEWECAVYLCYSSPGQIAAQPDCRSAVSKITSTKKPVCPGVIVHDSEDVTLRCRVGEYRAEAGSEELTLCPQESAELTDDDACNTLTVEYEADTCLDMDSGEVVPAQAETLVWRATYDVAGQTYPIFHVYEDWD